MIRSKIIITLVIVSLASSYVGFDLVWAQADGSEEYDLLLKTRAYTPPQGLETSSIANMQESPEGLIYFLMQFETIPDIEAKKQLSAAGIDLVNYVSSNTYIASSSISNLNSLDSVVGLQSGSTFNSADKISPDLQREEIGEWAHVQQDEELLADIIEDINLTDDNLAVITIEFNGNVKIGTAEKIVTELGGQIISIVPVIPSITAIFDLDKLNELADQSAVQFIDVVGPSLEEVNDSARVAANVIPVTTEPYGLTGSGVDVLVYDGGVVRKTHPDFGNRVVEVDPLIAFLNDHATHVAGTVAGNGANSEVHGGTANQWAGVAPEAKIHSYGFVGSADSIYDTGGDIHVDFTTSINNGIDLATMSLGLNAFKRDMCERLGDYGGTSRLIDAIVTGSIGEQQVIFFEAAGNERGWADLNRNGMLDSGEIEVCGKWHTITPPATAKNSIAVGAINAEDNSLTSFTSLGPTKDGRLKPDLTAPGCKVNGAIISTSIENDGYKGKCGTSMATPLAAGVGTLLIEQWQGFTGGVPLPHTIKAIMIHSADDEGNVGPDYEFGWGVINARSAADLVNMDQTSDIINVGDVDFGQVDSYEINAEGVKNMKATLVWDDEPATRLAIKTIVNDLDLRVVDPDGNTYQPFLLNPSAPQDAATTGIDSINNVEMVVGNANEGIWRIDVVGTHVPVGPQQYTLIVSEHPTEQPIDNLVVTIDSGVADSGQSLSIDVVFTDLSGDILEHVNYDIVASQENEVILDERDMHDHDGSASHTTSLLPNAVSDEMPIDVTVTFKGFGVSEPFTGPIGQVTQTKVVPEFGTITILILGVAVVSIILMSTKSRLGYQKIGI